MRRTAGLTGLEAEVSRRGSPRQRKIKSGPRARTAFSPGAAAMPLDNTPHIGQSDPNAFKLRDGVQPLKYPEEFARILHVEARTVVADVDQPLRFLVGCANFNTRFVTVAGEFQSVAD